MKKTGLLLGCLLWLSTYVNAQDFYGQLDVHGGYSAPLGRNYPVNGGISMGIEPKFWFNDEIAIGAKLGTNFLSSPVKDVKLAPLSTLMLVGEKYMGEEELKVFYGGALGLYMGGHIRKKAPKQLGITPRAGLQFGPYRLLGELHMRKQEAKIITISLGYTLGAQ